MNAGEEKVRVELVPCVVTSWGGAKKRSSLTGLAAPWPVWWAIQLWLLAHILQAWRLQSLGALSSTSSWDAGMWEGEIDFPTPRGGTTFLFCMGHPTDYVADMVSTISCLTLYIINALSELC